MSHIAATWATLRDSGTDGGDDWGDGGDDWGDGGWGQEASDGDAKDMDVADVVRSTFCV